MRRRKKDKNQNILNKFNKSSQSNRQLLIQAVNLSFPIWMKQRKDRYRKKKRPLQKEVGTHQNLSQFKKPRLKMKNYKKNSPIFFKMKAHQEQTFQSKNLKILSPKSQRLSKASAIHSTMNLLSQERETLCLDLLHKTLTTDQ